MGPPKTGSLHIKPGQGHFLFVGFAVLECLGVGGWGLQNCYLNLSFEEGVKGC